MTSTPSRKSNSLGPHDPIPEMDLRDFARLMHEYFELATEWIEGKTYCVKLIASPYNTFVEGCRHLRVMARGRETIVSPHNIIHVLDKFKIEHADFREAYNAFYGLPPQSTTSSKPARPN